MEEAVGGGLTGVKADGMCWRFGGGLASSSFRRMLDASFVEQIGAGFPLAFGPSMVFRCCAWPEKNRPVGCSVSPPRIVVHLSHSSSLRRPW
jgi:hypothetical protein